MTAHTDKTNDSSFYLCKYRHFTNSLTDTFLLKYLQSYGNTTLHHICWMKSNTSLLLILVSRFQK